ncbi:hypothetical protein [Streptomyces sp. NPDC056056]|uniref:hypothetical protein n=1 Tax=Streptomyces sp. NPDC056056 TaxID=3345698 RepID=UPI0035D8A1FD
MARSDIRIVTIDNTHPDFYRLVGPLLARRDVYKSLGGVPWDDEGKRWTIAVATGPGSLDRAAGFIGLTTKGALESLWAEPARRDTLYPRLVAAAVQAADTGTLHTTVTHNRVPAYEQAGFTTVSTTQNYAKMSWEPSP